MHLNYAEYFKLFNYPGNFGIEEPCQEPKTASGSSEPFRRKCGGCEAPVSCMEELKKCSR
jgi:hypothetical protein